MRTARQRLAAAVARNLLCSTNAPDGQTRPSRQAFCYLRHSLMRPSHGSLSVELVTQTFC